MKTSELFEVDGIVRNIRNSRSFLSTSTRGVESEVHGQVIAVSKTVRGLTLIVNPGGTSTKRAKVIWPCPAKVADEVVKQFA